ncbi:MAG: quinoprotein dehydrogenase-associated SoxYZ-like carrier, partial [Pseudomonadota bacterium]
AVSVAPSHSGGIGALLPPYAQGPVNPIVPSETWDLLKEDVAGDAFLLDGEDLVSISAPETAYDAATVPIAIEQRLGTEKRITKMTIVVDENPAPVAAVFEFGPLMGDIHLETRVRYDVFSNIRAVAETEGGEIYMAGRFVKAAGGCSVPVTRDLSAALETMGQMKLKMFRDTSLNPFDKKPEASGAVREAQLLLRHPNFTGMQYKKGTMDFIDPRFVNELEVWQGEERLFRMTGGFSISENPSFRFKYIDNGAQELRIWAKDTEGAEFTRTFPVDQGA